LQTEIVSETDYNIVYVISHGFSARMITQTNLLGKLVDKGLKVGLISTDNNDPGLKKYCTANNIDHFQFDKKGKLWLNNYMLKRRYFLENLEENTALLEKHIYATKYNSSINPVARILPFYYWSVYKLIKQFPSIRNQFLKKEKKGLKSLTAMLLIQKLNPEKLVVTYPVSYNEAVLLHYGNNNSKTETWIHLLSWDNITCKGKFPELADKFIAWGEVMENELKEYYRIKEKNIYKCGVPHFDVHIHAIKHPDFEPYFQKFNLNPQIPYIFFAMSSPRFAPREIDIVEWLAKQVELGSFGKLQLVVRPHPQNVQGKMADKNWLPKLEYLNKLKCSGVDFPEMNDSNLQWSIKTDDMDKLAHIMAGSSLVINSGSTISVEAILIDKPVILTSFDAHQKLGYWRSARRLKDYPHFKKLLDYNAITVTNNFEDLEKKIKSSLKYPDNKRLERRKVREKYFASIGSGTECTVKTLTTK